MSPLIVPAVFAVVAVGWRLASGPARQHIRPAAFAWSIVAGVLTTAAWFAPIGIAFATGRLTFTYGTMGFDPAFKQAVPLVALLLAVGFMVGVEPALRRTTWRLPWRIAAGTAVYLVIVVARRAGPTESLQWVLAIWEAIWLGVTFETLGRCWPGGPGAALPITLAAVIRLYALSRFDGPFETLGHMVTPDVFHLLAQGLLPAVIGTGWLMASRGGPRTGRRSGR